MSIAGENVGSRRSVVSLCYVARWVASRGVFRPRQQSKKSGASRFNRPRNKGIQAGTRTWASWIRNVHSSTGRRPPVGGRRRGTEFHERRHSGCQLSNDRTDSFRGQASATRGKNYGAGRARDSSPAASGRRYRYDLSGPIPSLVGGRIAAAASAGPCVE